MTSPVSQADIEAVIERWSDWAVCGAQLARIAERDGLTVDAVLHDTRCHARRRATRIVRDANDPADAVTELMAMVGQLRIISPPLIGFDAAMVAYTCARTLQACARDLDPAIVELQPRWT
ncbi:MAG: hypothetical protein ACRDRL_00605 [Sciscionella sp.]